PLLAQPSPPLRVRPAPPEVGAELVADHPRALARQAEGAPAADAPARSGAHAHFAREQRAHRIVLRAPALPRPARECQLKGRAARRVFAAPGGLVKTAAVDRIIFLIGAPRSGTTLLARMLGAHSMI